MNSALLSTVGFVLSITTLFLEEMAACAAAKHLGIVLSVSYFVILIGGYQLAHSKK